MYDPNVVDPPIVLKSVIGRRTRHRFPPPIPPQLARCSAVMLEVRMWSKLRRCEVRTVTICPVGKLRGNEPYSIFSKSLFRTPTNAPSWRKIKTHCTMHTRSRVKALDQKLQLRVWQVFSRHFEEKEEEDGDIAPVRENFATRRRSDLRRREKPLHRISRRICQMQPGIGQTPAMAWPPGCEGLHSQLQPTMWPKPCVFN